jgi:catechol 2,3-dioxygenase-like lactoylglutathione lyase family enzyme
MKFEHGPNLDSIHHVAVEVDDVSASVDWYQALFKCRVEYQDDTWALIGFDNLRLALVTKGQHPPHVGFVTERAKSCGELKTHRDGTRSVYITDPSGKAVELLDPRSS